MAFETEGHYAHIASDYDLNWAHNPAYVTQMSEAISSRLRVRPGERALDVGAGTGLFLRTLEDVVSADNPLVCVDPSQPMLDQLPDDPRLRPLRATAEQVATRVVELPYDQVDAILVKEAIHHVTDIATTIQGLADLLAPGGRFLVVTLPPQLDYPIFTAALERFAQNQPEPTSIVEAMTDAGLETDLAYQDFPVQVERDHYLELVARRWMSVLFTFTEDEIADGLAEIRRAHPERTLRFTDRFAFVLGTKAAH